MAQIVTQKAITTRCNLQSISTGGSKAGTVLANREIWLVDTTNSDKGTEGYGKYDSYIVGNGSSPASALTVLKIDDDTSFVHKDGAETIGGNKTFSGIMKLTTSGMAAGILVRGNDGTVDTAWNGADILRYEDSSSDESVIGIGDTVEECLTKLDSAIGQTIEEIGTKANKSNPTAGTYNQVTINSEGIVTGGSNPTKASEHGITDALVDFGVERQAPDGVILYGEKSGGNYTDYVPIFGATENVAGVMMPAHVSKLNNLETLYMSLTQNDVVVVDSTEWSLMTTWQKNTIYRVAGDNEYYDYIWDGVSIYPTLMATYGNNIENNPEYNSNNLVSSGGVFNQFKKEGVFDISEYNKSGDTPFQYASLSAALGENGVNVPVARRMGGMSVKFINSASGKYEQWRLMSSSWSTMVSDWQGIADEPTAGSNNLTRSADVFDIAFSMTKEDNMIELESGTINATTGAVVVDTEKFRTRGYIDCSSWTEAHYIYARNKQTRNTILGGRRYYDSSKNYLGSTWLSEAAWVRVTWNSTVDYNLNTIDAIVIDGVGTIPCTRYKVNATKDEVASKEISIKESIWDISNEVDNIKEALDVSNETFYRVILGDFGAHGDTIMSSDYLVTLDYLPIESSDQTHCKLRNRNGNYTDDATVKRYYDSSKNYLGTAYSDGAVYLRVRWTKTSGFGIDDIIAVRHRGVDYPVSSWWKVASNLHVANVASNLSGDIDSVREDMLIATDGLFSNIFDNSLANLDLANRIDTRGRLVSNSGFESYVVNKPLKLLPGTYYVKGGTALANTPPRISDNGTDLITVTDEGNGVYSFVLSEVTIVYIQLRLADSLLTLKEPVYISKDSVADREETVKRFKLRYMGLDTLLPRHFSTLVEEKTYNFINPANISYSIRYSTAQGKLISIGSSDKYASTGFVEVEEGKTYCINGTALYGNSYSSYQVGYFDSSAQFVVGQNVVARVTLYATHGDGGYFTVPSGQNIKYICALLKTNNDKTDIDGWVQLEEGENPTNYKPYQLVAKIKSELLPDDIGGSSDVTPVVTVSALDKYKDFTNIHYPNAGDKIPKFRQHWILRDKDLCVVNTGTSLTARNYCTDHPDASYRPPLLHTYNLASYVWDKLNWGNQQYRRYDAKLVKGSPTDFFTETGTWTTTYTDDIWDDSSYRNGLTRLAESGSNSIAFVVPVDAWQFNFIHRTDAQGCQQCTITITEGNGYMEAWNGSAWVEANGYVFSMREGTAAVVNSVTYMNPKTGESSSAGNLTVGGNTTYQKRLKMRCTTHKIVKEDGTVLVAGNEKHVTISGTGRMMYWGVEWSPRQYMITYINAARGSHGPGISDAAKALIHYQDNEIWSFKPDLMLTEDPIFNGGGGGPHWISNSPSYPIEYWYRVVNNFFFADNQVSMTARATTLLGSENVPEFVLFGPYSTALDGKQDDNGDLLLGPLSNGQMINVVDALQSVYYYMKVNHSEIIYIDCVRTWMEIVNDVYGGDIYEATKATAKTGTSLTYDGVHPNDNGSKVWARLVLPVLDFVY